MSKNHDALPVPEVQIYARPLGKLQFTCPNCGQDHPFKMVHWRRSDLRCQRCSAKYQFGLGFDTTKSADAYLMGKWDSYTANRLNPHGTPYDGARIYGSIEWQCPRCQTATRGFLQHNSCLQCTDCSAEYYISVLLYRLPKVGRLKLKAPFDSLVKGLSHVKKPLQPLPSAPPNPSTGTPSSSPRGDS